MPPRYLMPDVIVCIPGITGSVLRKDNRDIWNISGSAVLNALRTLGDDLQELKLEDDPVDVDDVDGITAPSVIRDVHLIPGIWKIDGYTKLVKHIKDKFDVKEGENLFEFPYDWRRDNRVASRQLATKAKGWLDAWRQKSGNKNAKLIVDRPLDGRARRAPLHRVPRGLARHAHADHARDAVPRLDVRGRHARQRQEDQVLRPHGRLALDDRPAPADADLRVLRRRRRQARARRRGADPAPRRGEGEGGARLPPGDRGRGRGEHEGPRVPDAATTSGRSSASSSRPPSR